MEEDTQFKNKKVVFQILYYLMYQKNSSEIAVPKSLVPTPYEWFWCWQIHYEGKLEGEIKTFLGPVKWHRATRQVTFGDQKSRDFQGPTPPTCPCNGFARINTITYSDISIRGPQVVLCTWASRAPSSHRWPEAHSWQYTVYTVSAVEPLGENASLSLLPSMHCKSGSHKNGIRKSSRKRYNHIMGI